MTAQMPPLTELTSLELIRRIQALPKTHVVITTYECGKVRRHESHSLDAARNHAVGEKRKVGRTLIDRDTGKKVRVISVEVLPL